MDSVYVAKPLFHLWQSDNTNKVTELNDKTYFTGVTQDNSPEYPLHLLFVLSLRIDGLLSFDFGT